MKKNMIKGKLMKDTAVPNSNIYTIMYMLELYNQFCSQREVFVCCRPAKTVNATAKSEGPPR